LSRLYFKLIKLDVIQFSEDDKKALENICSLGFDLLDAKEAYLACDKNE
jgi:hypothetical protein